MNLSKIPSKGFLSTKKDKLARDIAEYLSGNTNPKNFIGLCFDEGLLFFRPSVDHTITIDGACDKNGGLSIQAIIDTVEFKVSILCTSYKSNGNCKIGDGNCPFHNDKKVLIINPVKGLD